MAEKVLYLVSDLESGIGVSLLSCIGRLNGRFEIRLCELHSHDSANKEVARRMGVTVLELGKRGVNATVAFDLLEVMREFRPSLVQGSELETNFYACVLGRLVGARVVASFHGTVSPFRWFMAPFLYLVLVTADRIVCVSSAIAGRCLRRAPWVRRKLVVIPNGVDASAFAPRFARTMDGDRMTVTYVANFHSPEKGHEYLLRAVALLDRDEAELWLVGSGTLMDEMKGLAEELAISDRVKFLGQRRDVATLLAETDVFVMPSLSEGCPHALLEAMAAGVPVIATAVDGILEIVCDRATGLLVPPKDPAAIGDALRELAGDRRLYRRLRENALRHVCESFDAGRAARRFEDLYGFGAARS